MVSTYGNITTTTHGSSLVNQRKGDQGEPDLGEDQIGCYTCTGNGSLAVRIQGVVQLVVHVVEVSELLLAHSIY